MTREASAATDAMDLERILRIARLYPDRVRLFPLGANLQGLARANRKRDAWAKVSIEDEWVKALQGPVEEQPLVFLVHIPRELVGLAEAPLVLPQDVGAIVAPRGR